MREIKKALSCLTVIETIGPNIELYKQSNSD